MTENPEEVDGNALERLEDGNDMDG